MIAARRRAAAALTMVCNRTALLAGLIVLAGCAISPGGPVAGETAARSLVVLAYNVKYGDLASAEHVAAALGPQHPDIVMLSEVPDGGWTQRMGAALGLPYAYVGSVSSANHEDKFKAIVSRTPLIAACEITLEHDQGWSPASTVRAVTLIDGMPIALYSLHIANAPGLDGQAWRFARDVLPIEPVPNVVIGGDFNARPDEPEMQVIESAGFTTVWRATGQDTEAMSSAPEWTHDGLIDHILFRSGRGVAVSRAGVLLLDPPLSDHHPVWTRLSVRAAPKPDVDPVFPSPLCRQGRPTP